LQAGLLDQFRQLALTAIEQQVELKARVKLARRLGRVGDPRVVDDLSDPAAWVEVPAGTYNFGDRKVAETFGKERSLSVASVTFARPFQRSR